MNSSVHYTYLSEDEVAFDRMQTFHRDRVHEIASRSGTSGKSNEGVLVVHLVSKMCFLSRHRLDTPLLKEIGGRITPLGGHRGQTRFNTDGLLNYDGYEGMRAYSLLFRDGRFESVMSDAKYPLGGNEQSNVFVLRDAICEKAVFKTVGEYMKTVAGLGLAFPIWMYSALVGCERVRICTDLGFRDISEHGIDRSPCFLPECELTSADEQPQTLLHPWCDTLWQACGMERSFNYDNDGNWRERRR